MSNYDATTAHLAGVSHGDLKDEVMRRLEDTPLPENYEERQEILRKTILQVMNDRYKKTQQELDGIEAP